MTYKRCNFNNEAGRDASKLEILLAKADYLRNLTNNVEDAIALYTEVIRLEPTFAKAYINRAAAHSLIEDFDSAVADYTEAIRLEPTLADTYASRGMARSSLGDFDGAILDYTEAVRLESTNDAHFYCRGLFASVKKTLKARLLIIQKPFTLSLKIITTPTEEMRIA